MATYEACGVKKEEYKGEEIENIVFDGAVSAVQRVHIYLKNGKAIELSAKMNITPVNINPFIMVVRGLWGRVKNTSSEIQDGNDSNQK